MVCSHTKIMNTPNNGPSSSSGPCVDHSFSGHSGTGGQSGTGGPSGTSGTSGTSSTSGSSVLDSHLIGIKVPKISEHPMISFKDCSQRPKPNWPGKSVVIKATEWTPPNGPDRFYQRNNNLNGTSGSSGTFGASGMSKVNIDAEAMKRMIATLKRTS